MSIKWLTKTVKTLFRVISLCIKPVKFIKLFADLVKVISVKLLEMLRYVGMSIIIQYPSKSNPSKCIKDNLDHVFNWSVSANAPKKTFQPKVLEAYYIVLEKPTLNEQLQPDRLNLF